MKSFARLSVIALIAVTVAEAESSDPKPSPTPASISGEMEEPVLPTPDATPGDAGATLLPESDELPANSAVGQPAGVSLNRLAPKPSAAEKTRFDKVRSMAMNSPRAAYLLKRARNSSSVATRRTYLRAYYSTVAARMRKLDPGLKSSIDEYEEAKVQQVAGSGSQSNGSTRQSRSHRTASRVPHHRSRKVAAHHRHERMMILYYPYGPDMPPYGPPMVFDPW